MSRRLWFDPGFGASGDMILGALVGLGVAVDDIVADLRALAVPGWSLTASTASRSGLSATRVVVEVTAEIGHRSWSTIDALLAAAELPAPVGAGARRTFRRLAEVEAAIHQVDIDAVHFHEIGAVDAIVDIVGAWSALSRLSVDRVHAGPVGLGNGVVPAAHGLLSAPAPATLALLEGTAVRPVPSSDETVTPTGAALLTTMVDEWGPIPEGVLAGASRGAGGRDPATHANVLGALLLVDSWPTDSTDGVGAEPTAGDAVLLATTLDDVSPEILGHTIERLLAAGADDAWSVPATMKKQRPGHELRILCAPQLAPALRDLVFRETGTLGIRTEQIVKHRLDRIERRVVVRGHEIRLKLGPHGAKPEHDDVVAAARATGAAARHIAAEALLALGADAAAGTTRTDEDPCG